MRLSTNHCVGPNGVLLPTKAVMQQGGGARELRPLKWSMVEALLDCRIDNGPP